MVITGLTPDQALCCSKLWVCRDEMDIERLRQVFGAELVASMQQLMLAHYWDDHTDTDVAQQVLQRFQLD